MRKIFLILCYVSLFCSCIRDSEIVYTNTPIGNFEALWTIIDQKYCFVEEKGVDWDAIHEEYKFYVDTLQNNDYRGLFNTLADMLNCLKDGHVNLYSQFDVSRTTAWYDGYPENFDSELLDLYLGKDYKRAGGLSYNIIPNLVDSIGYIRYSSFSNGFSTMNMYYILDYFSPCKGIILDVRSNGGGSLEYSYALASTFMEETTHIGYWRHKTGPGHQDLSDWEELYVNEKDMPVKWHKPVIVLTNRQCYSATNMFVNCMQHAPRCCIMGGKTGGGGGMPLSYELPNGWMVRFSSVKLYNTDKQCIEEGIEPDVVVTLVSKDKDDIIEEAIQKIKVYD